MGRGFMRHDLNYTVSGIIMNWHGSEEKLSKSDIEEAGSENSGRSYSGGSGAVLA